MTRACYVLGRKVLQNGMEAMTTACELHGVTLPAAGMVATLLAEDLNAGIHILEVDHGDHQRKPELRRSRPVGYVSVDGTFERPPLPIDPELS